MNWKPCRMKKSNCFLTKGQTMKERQRRSIIVGVFVIAGIFLFMFAIYLIGKKEYAFGRSYTVCAVFSDVKGLKDGDKVRMSGIDIGTVSALEFTGKNQVLVHINIDHEQFYFIKEGAKVVIGSQGLMGAKVVRLIPGDYNGEPISPYDTLLTIEQVELNDIIQEVNKISGDIGIVSSELASITQKINRGEGVFGKLLSDTEASVDVDMTLKSLSELTENFNDISEKINNGEGFIGTLLEDNKLSADMNAAGENISQIAANLNELTEKLNDTTMTGTLFNTARNLQSTTENLMHMTAALNDDNNALNLLIDDPAFADSLEVMIEKLNIGIIEATEAAEAIQRSGLIRLGGKKRRDNK